jgi:hypothetical protein
MCVSFGSEPTGKQFSFKQYLQQWWYLSYRREDMLSE